MVLKNIKSRHSAGDTIVEVMIVLAVLGLGIGISYATANRSLLNARQAEETSEATELVQSQIELLRSMAGILASNPNYIFLPSANYFCINTSNNVTNLLGPPNPGIWSSYPTAPSGGCVNGRYYIAIQQLPVSPTTGANTFEVIAYWDDVFGNGQDSVTMTYKVHP